MDSVMFRAKLIPLRTGSVQKGIRIGVLEGVYVVKPDDAILEAFSTKVRPLYLNIGKLEQQNHELTALRDFLLPLLMNGQVTVGKPQAKKQRKQKTQQTKLTDFDSAKYQEWKTQIGIAARGDIDEQTLENIYEAMDADDR
jgi:type I restriction enzyme S subunit